MSDFSKLPGNSPNDGSIVIQTSASSPASPEANQIESANLAVAQTTVLDVVEGAGHAQAASPSQISFTILQALFPKTITLSSILAMFDISGKPDDVPIYDWIWQKVGQILTVQAARLVRFFAILLIPQTTWPLANALLANLGINANAVPPPLQIPLLPVINGQLQPPFAGQPAAPIPANQIAQSTKLILSCATWLLSEIVSDWVEAEFSQMINGGVTQIRNGSSQMSVITVVNNTRFPFEVTDSACYKGSFTTVFKRLEARDYVDEGTMVSVGVYSSNSGVTTGSASAIKVTSQGAPPPLASDSFIIAAADPIIGKNTTLVAINDPKKTAYELADENDTSGAGVTHFEGDGNAFHIWADVEGGAYKKYCHVRVLITEKN